MFPQLQTERLLLQELTAADQQFVFEGLSHPDVIPFYGVRYETFDATEAQMDWYNNMFAEGSGIAWKMVEKMTNQPIGVVAVYYYKPEHKKAEIGFWLLPQFWQKGFALEALQAIIHYWKTEKDLHRLEGFVEEGNSASSKLLAKAGFEYEGKMRDCEIKNGKYISLHIYGLIL